MAMRNLDLNWALTAILPPIEFVLPGLLPKSFGLIVAPGATGKSTLALDLAISTAVGRMTAGGLFPAQVAGKVVYLAGEESPRILAERLRNLLRLDEMATPALYDNLVILPMSGESCLLVSGGEPTSLLDELIAICVGARLVIVDPLRRLHDGDENSSADAMRVVHALERLAVTSGAAVIGIHHANRATAGDSSSQHLSRGSSALVDGARWQLNLSRMDEKSAEKLRVAEMERHLYVAADFAKTNYMSPRPRCWLKRQSDGRLVLEAIGHTMPKLKSFGGAKRIG